MYPTLEAYYGVHWRLQGWEYRWRVSYVRTTGEIYVVHQGRTIGPPTWPTLPPPFTSLRPLPPSRPSASIADTAIGAPSGHCQPLLVSLLPSCNTNNRVRFSLALRSATLSLSIGGLGLRPSQI